MEIMAQELKTGHMEFMAQELKTLLDDLLGLRLFSGQI